MLNFLGSACSDPCRPLTRLSCLASDQGRAATWLVRELRELYLTNDVPQGDHIIIARGRHTEGRHFHTASAVVVGIKGFDVMLSYDKTAIRRNGSFRL